jgi:hypothetical protein
MSACLARSADLTNRTEVPCRCGQSGYKHPNNVGIREARAGQLNLERTRFVLTITNPEHREAANMLRHNRIGALRPVREHDDQLAVEQRCA